MTLTPWKLWGEDKNPDWWQSYNKVKHERNNHFNEATLKNVLDSMAGLLLINYLYCRLDLTKATPHLRDYSIQSEVTRYMEPQSTLLRFEPHFYDNPFAVLGQEIKEVSEYVTRLKDYVDSGRF